MISTTEAAVERTSGDELDDAWWALSLSSTLLAASYNFVDEIEGWTSPGGLRPDDRLIDRLLFEKLQDLEETEAVGDVFTLCRLWAEQTDRIDAAAKRWFEESKAIHQPVAA